MGTKITRTYDKEFKNNAVSLYKEGGKSYQAVADSLGIPCATLVGWVKAKRNFRRFSLSWERSFNRGRRAI